MGLNRYTGRERWQFNRKALRALQPPEADEKIITTWWSSKTADSVYSIDLDTGAKLSEWMVARRPRLTELPADLDSFCLSALSTWRWRIDSSLEQSNGKARRKSIKTPQTPNLLGSQVQYWTKRRTKSPHSTKRASGTERWSYERRNVRTFEARRARTPRLTNGKNVAVIVLNIVSGQVVGIGPLGHHADVGPTTSISDFFIRHERH